MMQNKSKTLPLLLATGLITCALFGQRAQAVPIDGTIGFFGTGSVTTGATTTVNFSNLVQTIYGSDDYSGVPSGTLATFKSIEYVGTGGGATLIGPVTPLWTFTLGTTIYSFDLTSLTSAVTYSGSGLSSLTLAGLGTSNITGFEPTQGNFAIQGTGPNLSFQFVSASTTANGTAVPDGGMTVAFLGFALVGLEGLRRTLPNTSKTA